MRRELVGKWICGVLLFTIAISALVLACLAYTKTSLSLKDQTTLQEITQKLSFDGNVLVAAGFSDDSDTSSSPFLVKSGHLTTETITTAGDVAAGSLVAASGFTLEAGELTASKSLCTFLGVETSDVAISDTIHIAHLTNEVFTMSNSLSFANVTLGSSRLLFNNVNAQSTSMSATGITVPNKNLIGLRFLGNGPIDTTPVGVNAPMLIAPVSFTNVYGSFSVPLADLVPQSTFEIVFSASFVNKTGFAQNLYLTLVNGPGFSDAQNFIGRPPPFIGPADPTLNVDDTTGIVNFGVPNDTASFCARFLVTLQSINIDESLATTYTSGKLSAGCSQTQQNGRSFVFTEECITTDMVVLSGFNFTIWATTTADSDFSITPRQLTLRQLI